ncbi:MAG: hypothetical protein AVDCRST_MAG40-824, partial [uncultured Gemmatimonadaceae bacterium]
ARAAPGRRRRRARAAARARPRGRRPRARRVEREAPRRHRVGARTIFGPHRRRRPHQPDSCPAAL